MNTEMNNNNNNNNVEGVSVTSLLLKTLENATKDYARECIMKCALSYGFDGSEAMRRLNLEKLTIQVKEMKRRSVAKAKPEKKVSEKKEGEKKEGEKKAEKVEEIMLPFMPGAIKESGCMGLAYNGGLFTQCKKTRKQESEYCNRCFSETEERETGLPQIGTVSGRCAVGLMEFRDGKGRKPVPYSKIMKEKGISRERAELEAGKLNLTIDEMHFVVVDEKKEAGRPKREKRVKVVESAVSVEDLFASLIEEDEESSQHDTVTVLCSESESDSESEIDNRQRELAHEKVERGMMKEEETGMKKVVKAEEKAAKEHKMMEEKELKAQKLIEEKAAKEQKLIEEKAAKEQKLIEEKAAKEQKLIEEKAAKEQKLIEEKAAKELKAQKLIEEKELKAQKLIEEKELKAQKLIEEKAAKEQKLIEEKAAKEQKIVADLAAKEQKLIEEKAAKEQKIVADLAAKEEKAQKLIEEKALKAAKIVQEKKEKEEKAQKMMEEKALKTAKVTSEKEKKVEKVEKVVEAPKKVTVKRITIDGKQYLKTADNVLYDPETREEMGIYDAETNTIKELPDDDEDEIEEEGYNSD